MSCQPNGRIFAVKTHVEGGPPHTTSGRRNVRTSRYTNRVPKHSHKKPAPPPPPFGVALNATVAISEHLLRVPPSNLQLHLSDNRKRLQALGVMQTLEFESLSMMKKDEDALVELPGSWMVDRFLKAANTCDKFFNCAYVKKQLEEEIRQEQRSMDTAVERVWDRMDKGPDLELYRRFLFEENPLEPSEEPSCVDWRQPQVQETEARSTDRPNH